MQQKTGWIQVRRLAALHAEAIGNRRTQAGHGPERLEPRIASRGQRRSVGQAPLHLHRVRRVSAQRVDLHKSTVSRILSGLAEGDCVILSDMSAWDGRDRVKLR